MSTYQAIIPTPIYNTQHLPHHQSKIPKDSKGFIRSLEMIAFPGTKFLKKSQASSLVIEVLTKEYLSSSPLYVDPRFLLEVPDTAPERNKTLPSSEKIMKWMISLVGTRYFWGGNWVHGIPEMLTLYPQLSIEDRQDVICQGVDCSGLLFQATSGTTPRNSRQLTSYGKPLEVDILSPKKVQSVIQPLDLVVWPGHVMIALNSENLIESAFGHGVRVVPFLSRYMEVLDKLQQEKKPLYLRRWHPEFLVS